MKIILFVYICLFMFFSCTKMNYVDEDAFIGTWELKGRNIYNQMTVSIVKEDGKLKGYIVSLPNNKYGEFFLEEKSPWILSVSRSANHYFKITEEKIASDLFVIYNLEETSTFYVTFSKDHSKFYLSENTPHGIVKESSIYYKRIEQ